MATNAFPYELGGPHARFHSPCRCLSEKLVEHKLSPPHRARRRNAGPQRCCRRDPEIERGTRFKLPAIERERGHGHFVSLCLSGTDAHGVVGDRHIFSTVGRTCDK